MKRLQLAIIATFLGIAQAAIAGPRAAPAHPMVDVKVYFFFPIGMRDPKHNPLDLKAVKRRVGKAHPDYEALLQLLKGPSTAEVKAGFAGVETEGFRLDHIISSAGTWDVHIVSRGLHHWSGDLSPGRFQQAVVWTIKQFPGVKKVVVYLNDRKYPS